MLFVCPLVDRGTQITPQAAPSNLFCGNMSITSTQDSGSRRGQMSAPSRADQCHLVETRLGCFIADVLMQPGGSELPAQSPLPLYNRGHSRETVANCTFQHIDSAICCSIDRSRCSFEHCIFLSHPDTKCSAPRNRVMFSTPPTLHKNHRAYWCTLSMTMHFVLQDVQRR